MQFDEIVHTHRPLTREFEQVVGHTVVTALEIHGCNPIGVVAEKSLPPLRRRTSPSQHVFRNRRLGDIKAELEQLAMNPRRAPKRIFLCTYGARDLGVLDQSRAGRLDCEISSATRRENPSCASE